MLRLSCGTRRPKRSSRTQTVGPISNFKYVYDVIGFMPILLPFTHTTDGWIDSCLQFMGVIFDLDDVQGTWILLKIIRSDYEISLSMHSLPQGSTTVALVVWPTLGQKGHCRSVYSPPGSYRSWTWSGIHAWSGTLRHFLADWDPTSAQNQRKNHPLFILRP